MCPGLVWCFFYINPFYIGVFAYAFLASSLLVSIQTG